MATDVARIPATTAQVERAISGRRVDWKELAFLGMLLFALLLCLGVLIVLLYDVLAKGSSVLLDRPTDFVTSGLSRQDPLHNAGVWQGILGSLYIALITAVVAFPLGIATAVYLEEYARDNRLTRFVALNIRNLAGVPSIVYGILGLVLFVQILGRDLTDGGGLTGGSSVIAGGLTIAVLVLPIVIITASEAIRAVPQSLREGGYGVGATRWEVTRTLVLPNAAPGILTGTVLSMSRAIGETAPLILVGAIFGSGFLATGEGTGFVEELRGPFTSLPTIVYGWARQPGADFRESLAPAAIVVLLVVTLLFNAVAILLRNRYEKRW